MQSLLLLFHHHLLLGNIGVRKNAPLDILHYFMQLAQEI